MGDLRDVPENDQTVDDLALVRKRVREKIESYIDYDFSRMQNDLLKCFFDLAQEFETLHDLYRVCVAAPHEALQVDCFLYMLDESRTRLELVCDSNHGVYSPPSVPKDSIRLVDEPYITGDSFVIPVYRKPPKDQVGDDNLHAFLAQGRQEWGDRKYRVMGIFEVVPARKLSESDRFFLTKYCNRIGYRLHNRFIAWMNIRHLKFINSLVLDIEHNVIIPNMYFKHLFNQLKKKIGEMEGIEENMKQLKESSGLDSKECDELFEKIISLRQNLMGYQQELSKHHANMTLFLESLFRREHFVQGHLVLQPIQCALGKDIITPQLEHYSSRFKAAGVSWSSKPEAGGEISITADKGLLSQVFANLFSNAVKYTSQVCDAGKTVKRMTYGWTIVENCFDIGKRCVRCYVYTTGPHFSDMEAANIYHEGFRGENTGTVTGKGHGLSFVKHIIEMHGGRVGYEKASLGNVFYFYLPLPVVELKLPLS
jgi:hypothetical protein